MFKSFLARQLGGAKLPDTSITFIYQKIINLRSAIGDSINLNSKVESKIINLTSSIKDSISGYSKERM